MQQQDEQCGDEYCGLSWKVNNVVDYQIIGELHCQGLFGSMQRMVLKDEHQQV